MAKARMEIGQRFHGTKVPAGGFGPQLGRDGTVTNSAETFDRGLDLITRCEKHWGFEPLTDSVGTAREHEVTGA